jgi:hypothetical protein
MLHLLDAPRQSFCTASLIVQTGRRGTLPSFVGEATANPAATHRQPGLAWTGRVLRCIRGETWCAKMALTIINNPSIPPIETVPPSNLLHSIALKSPVSPSNFKTNRRNFSPFLWDFLHEGIAVSKPGMWMGQPDMNQNSVHCTNYTGNSHLTTAHGVLHLTSHIPNTGEVTTRHPWSVEWFGTIARVMSVLRMPSLPTISKTWRGTVMFTCTDKTQLIKKLLSRAPKVHRHFQIGSC